MKPAFSYIRFSTPEQAKGDSFFRQSEMAEAWAEKHGYQIVKSWSDLGVSSFRGRNAKSGGFAEFLRAAEAKELPEGSVLLIENLDRMSRQKLHEALTLFLHIINLGVGIVTLTDATIYTRETLETNAISLFKTLAIMMRGNDESETKSKRVTASWDRKKMAARMDSSPITNLAPGWLDVSRDKHGRRIFKPNKTRVALVQRIFTESARGLGRRRIAKTLNKEGKRTFQRDTEWHTSSIIKIVRSRTVLGEYQPHRRNEAGKRVPDGAPIAKYYPAVIDEDLWVRANASTNIRRKDSSGRPHAEAANLIPGIAWCGECGARMKFLNKGDGPKGGRYYVCSRAERSGKCENRRLWRSDAVERYLIHQLDPRRISEALAPPTLMTGPSVMEIDAYIAELNDMKAAALDSLLRNKNQILGPDLERRAESLVAEIAVQQKRRDKVLAEERSRPHLPTVADAAGAVASIAEKLKDSSGAERITLRTSIIQQLRTVFAEVVFSPHSVSGLIELPGRPKSMKGPFGIPKPIVIRKDEKSDVERYFHRHPIFTDHPEVVATYGKGKGGSLRGRPADR